MPALTATIDRPLSGSFRYLWMKSVTGFSPGQHCARCLVGSYVSQVGLQMPLNKAVEIPAQDGALFYLCGVSAPYKWVNNLHLALRAKVGATASVEIFSGGFFTASGFEAVAFDGAAAAARFADRSAAFLTCRNFQFGAHMFPPS